MQVDGALGRMWLGKGLVLSLSEGDSGSGRGYGCVRVGFKTLWRWLVP
jgi:hypothetical protein